MENKHEVTLSLRRLLNHINRYSEQRMPKDRHITQAQGRVIGFIKHHPDKPVFQRDLEQVFQIRRSTASAMLKTMEKNDLILREPVPGDARLKRLRLTPRAEAFSDRVECEIALTDDVITRGVSDQEMRAFLHTIEIFEENLRRCAQPDIAAQAPDNGRKENDQTVRGVHKGF